MAKLRKRKIRGGTNKTPRKPAAKSAAKPVDDALARLRVKLAKARIKIRQLEKTAYGDMLTGALNRRGFERELARSLAYVQRYGADVALIYIDLDRFKACNDTHGHHAGDALLKIVTRALEKEVRASDVVARIGGDEFAVLMWNLGISRARIRTRDLERAIEGTRYGRGEPVCSVGASAGIAMLKPGATCAEMMKVADRAMYARKLERRKKAGGKGSRR